MELIVGKQYKLKDKLTELNYHGINICDIKRFSGKVVTITKQENAGSEGDGCRIKEDNNAWWWHKTLFEETLITKKGETKMSIPKVITDSYKETKDAVLVDKWFGGGVTSGATFNNVIFKSHKDDFLKEAKRLQKEEDDKE